MKSNRKNFILSSVIMAVSIVIITICTIYKDSHIVCEVVLNLMISLFAGAFLGAVLSAINFCNIRQEKSVAFLGEYVNKINSIIKLANWYSIRKDEIRYCRSYENKEIEAEQQRQDKQNNAIILEEFYLLVKKTADSDRSPLYTICDDYVGSLFGGNRFDKKQRLLLMRKMIHVFEEYNYTYHDDIYRYMDSYGLKQCDENVLYAKVVPFYEKLVDDKKVYELANLCNEFREKAKIDKQLTKVYGIKHEI